MGTELSPLSPLGASIQKIAIKTDRQESTFPVALPIRMPYSTVLVQDMLEQRWGPNAGRIQTASELPVGKQIFHLTPNENTHQLHGGPYNLSTIKWTSDPLSCTHDYRKSPVFSYQPDRMDGFPENRTYLAVYTPDDTNWLTVEYSARTDSPTYINLSNHTY